MATRRKAKAQEADEPKVYEQVEDERGRVRTDRPFDGNEALAQDERNRDRLEEQRRKRFIRRAARA